MKSFTELASMKGRVVAITGGAGHVGRAIAAAIVQMGGSTALIDRDESALAAAADFAGGGDAVATFALDLASEEQRAALPAQIAARLGRLDVLVNNAAFVGDSALQGWAVPLAEQRLDTWRSALEVNLTAPFHLVQLLHPMLAASGHGAVVNVASLYGVLGPDMSLYEGTNMGNPAAYAASKGAVVQLTRWLATTLAPDVRVNCVSPGGIARGQPQAFVDKYVKRTPMRRMGLEEDLIGAVAFLASDLSRWVTGENIMVDGGFSAW
jgi:NAD(P)-dependent dehydrogenase (short-subunit alcohol dehydrogenase family)